MESLNPLCEVWLCCFFDSFMVFIIFSVSTGMKVLLDDYYLNEQFLFKGNFISHFCFKDEMGHKSFVKMVNVSVKHW